jgi:ribosomal-protein-alanine N-acetyltransferase
MSTSFPQLNTDRLLLRELTSVDTQTLFTIHSDADNMKWFGSNPIKTLEEAEGLIQLFSKWRESPNPGTRWGIVRHADGMLVGTCGLFKWNREWKRSTVGYELAPSAQGHGYMREALTSVLAYGFNEMQLNRIDASVHPENIASVKLLNKLGFMQEGLTREAGYWGERYHDMLEFGLLRRYLAPGFLG